MGLQTIHSHTHSPSLLSPPHLPPLSLVVSNMGLQAQEQANKALDLLEKTTAGKNALLAKLDGTTVQNRDLQVRPTHHVTGWFG